MRAKKLNKKDFNEIYRKAPRLCIDLVLLEKNGVLFTKRAIKPYKGYWHFPGGTVYFREKIEEAVKRVAREELGIEVKILELVHCVEILKTSTGGHDVGLEFLIERTGGGEIKLDYQASKAEFFKIKPKKVIGVHWEVASKILRKRV